MMIKLCSSLGFTRRVIVNLFCFRLFFSIFITSMATSVFAINVSEQVIHDAILGVQTFTDEELHAMDLNDDGKVDVADLTYLNSNSSIANFISSVSEIDETVGTHLVGLSFAQQTTVNLQYTVGGTATEGSDFTAPSGSATASNGSATIAIPINSDTVYEGSETITLNLLPDKNYSLGLKRSHTITLHDNPNSSSSDYLFILSSKTMGVEGSVVKRTGFPETFFSRTVSINISFSQDNILSAHINETKSIGVKDINTSSGIISAKSVSYSSGALTMEFEYSSESESFVSSPSIIEFDAKAPSLGDQAKIPMINTMTLNIDNFDISTDKFADKYLEGSFSMIISGVLKERTSQFFEGELRGYLQP